MKLSELMLIKMWVVARTRDVRDDGERGELLTWVIMTALLAAAAIAVVAIIVTKATSTANGVQTQ